MNIENKWCENRYQSTILMQFDCPLLNEYSFSKILNFNFQWICSMHRTLRNYYYENITLLSIPSFEFGFEFGFESIFVSTQDEIRFYAHTLFIKPAAIFRLFVITLFPQSNSLRAILYLNQIKTRFWIKAFLAWT